MVTLPATQLATIKASLEAGLDYARECLATHEVNLGRTTKKNQLWGETMDRDIEQMEWLLETFPDLPNDK